MSKEIEILTEIRDSEKRAEHVVEKARRESQDIIEDAQQSSSELLTAKKEEIKELQKKRLSDVGDKASSMKNERLRDGLKEVKQTKEKAEKNISKAVEFVMKKFEAMI